MLLDFVKNRDLTLSNSNLKTIIKSAAGDKYQKIKCEFPQEEIIVKCDPLLLEMVFINMINNAEDIQSISPSSTILLHSFKGKKFTFIPYSDSSSF